MSETETRPDGKNRPIGIEPDAAVSERKPGESDIDRDAQPPLSGDAQAVNVADQLAAISAKAQEHYDAFLRAKAETDNVRRRAQEDVAKAHKFGIENFADALLPVMDSLVAALADTSADVIKLREGVELTRKQLASAFERNRLVEIDPLGEKFDPHRHQAISTVPANDGVVPNHVVTVLQKGWTLADRVLRPALVTVAR